MKRFLSNLSGFLCGMCVICAAGTDPGEVLDLRWTLCFILAAVLFGWLFTKLRRAAK